MIQAGHDKVAGGVGNLLLGNRLAGSRFSRFGAYEREAQGGNFLQAPVLAWRVGWAVEGRGLALGQRVLEPSSVS